MSVFRLCRAGYPQPSKKNTCTGFGLNDYAHDYLQIRIARIAGWNEYFVVTAVIYPTQRKSDV